MTIDAASASHRQRRPRRPPALGGLLRHRPHPELTFVSTSVERDGDDWAITGDLTIKDVTSRSRSTSTHRLCPGPVRQRAHRLRGLGHVSRKDWGLTWNAALETGGVLVSDKVKLELDVSAIKNA